MSYLTRDQLHTPGYYWWLPEYLKDRGDEVVCWNIVSFHPADRDFRYAGVFVGPLQAPIVPRGPRESMEMSSLTTYMAEKAALDLYRQFLKLTPQEKDNFLLDSRCNWPAVWEEYTERGELIWPDSQQ